MPKLILSDGDIEAIILDVYRGLIKPDNLPVDLYLATADELKKAVYKGYKSNLSSLEFGTPDYDLLNELRTNTYMFSAAKTAKQCAAMSSLMVENKELLKYKEFKVKALHEFKIYNTDYLKTEVETAITTAQTAREYQHIQDNISSFPLTKYKAVIDGRTAEICRMQDGVTLRSDDPFWHLHTPPQHFNCRCLLEPVDKYDAEQTYRTPNHRIEAIKEYADKNVNPVFKMNPVIDKYVFSPKHPYFKVTKSERKLAERNYNLPIPPND